MTDVSAKTTTTSPAASAATSPLATTSSPIGSLPKSKVASIDEPAASVNKSFTNGDGHAPPLITKTEQQLKRNNHESTDTGAGNMSTSLTSNRSSCDSSTVQSPTNVGPTTRSRMHSTDNGATTATASSSANNSISACDMTTLMHSSNSSAANTALNSPVSCSSPAGLFVGGGTTTVPTAGNSNGGSKVGRREATQQDVDEVARLFEEKPEAFEKWLMERAPPEALARLHEFIDSRKPPKRPSVTSDLFQQWMAASPVQVSGQ